MGSGNGVKRRIVPACGMCFVLTLCIVSCNILPVEKTWSVGGTTALKGTPSDSVMIAAFLVRRIDVFGADSVLVSNTNDLGTGGGHFSLYLDVEEQTVDSGDRVVLIFWEDSIDNKMYDEGESFQYAEPLPGCPVFRDTVSCLFFYVNQDDPLLQCPRGWNIDLGNLISVVVGCTHMSNAKITNWYSWD